jgi:putative Mn2+ efflux pump MntP
MKMNLTHFEATLLFAIFASLVMGIVTKKTDRDRFIYGAQCFGYFMLAVFGLGWLMYLGHG